MKNLVKESINEKFVEDSDPIADMGIGMKHQIKKWIETETGYKYKEKDLLWICAEEGKIEFVKYLLDTEADVHADNDHALQVASRNGHTDVVKLLLDAGADVHADNDHALLSASNYGHDKVVKILKDHIAKEKKNKVVKENLNEKFIEDSDPIEDMGIGIRHLIEEWIENYYRKLAPPYRDIEFTINDDGTIDVNNSSVNFYHSGLTKLPDYIQFNKVAGNFWINNNNLTTLKGCPRIVGGSFWCNGNKLKSLKYAPEKVGAKFGCSENAVKFTKKDVLKICKVDPKFIET